MDDGRWMIEKAHEDQVKCLKRTIERLGGDDADIRHTKDLMSYSDMLERLRSRLINMKRIFEIESRDKAEGVQYAINIVNDEIKKGKRA